MAKVGRKSITKEEQDLFFRKLEPYLKAGLSVHKACISSQLPTSTIYDIINEDKIFADKIEAAKNYMSISLSVVVNKHLLDIVKKQNFQPKEGEKKKKLNESDLSFIKWLAVNSNNMREEFGERKDIGIVDPQAEIAKINAIIEDACNNQE